MLPRLGGPGTGNGDVAGQAILQNSGRCLSDPGDRRGIVFSNRTVERLPNVSINGDPSLSNQASIDAGHRPGAVSHATAADRHEAAAGRPAGLVWNARNGRPRSAIVVRPRRASPWQARGGIEPSDLG